MKNDSEIEIAIIINSASLGICIAASIGAFVFTPQFETIVSACVALAISFVWHSISNLILGEKLTKKDLLVVLFHRTVLLLVASFTTLAVLDRMVSNYSLALITLALVTLACFYGLLAWKIQERTISADS